MPSAFSSMLWTMITLLPVVAAAHQPSKIHVGAIFTEDRRGSHMEMAFKYAVMRVNNDTLLLPNISLEYDIQYAYREDSFHAAKKACSQLQQGVVVLFGPADALLGSHVQSICDAVDVPHVETRLDVAHVPREFSINLHPSYRDLTRAFKDLMGFLNWTRVAVVYEEDAGLVRLQDLVRAPPELDMEVYIRQALPDEYRDVLREIKNKDIQNIVVDTKPENIQLFLRSLLQLQMNDDRHHYLFTSFDTETFDLEDFRYNRVNMTGYRLVDAASGWVQASLAAMEQFQPMSSAMVPAPNVIKAETALMFDAVNAFAHGLHAMSSAGAFFTPNVTCELLNTWAGGLQLYEHISAVQMPGLTGPIQFSGGRRTRLKLDLMKLTSSGMKKVGWWSDKGGINVTDSSAFYGTDLPNVTLLVSTIQEHPFVFKHENKTTGEIWYEGFSVDLLDHLSRMVGFRYRLMEEQDRRYGVFDPVTGQWDGMVRRIMDKERPFMMLKRGENGSTEPHQFEGFCVDLLERVAEIVGFRYRIELAPEAIFGYQDAVTGEWDGLVRQLIDKKADLVVASMTINYAREGVIDFTKPFMNLGISILFKVPNSQPTRLFSFLNPLAVEIWLYVMAAYMAVSFTMFVMARFSPYEWNNPHPCFDDNDVVENQFSVSNSFWFITGTLLRQGSGLNPKAASTRIVGSIWWFFTLIIISSYTANLAAFLTVERTTTPIESAADLAKQEDIEYGTLEGGSTMTFFRDSKIETYQKMWKFMASRKPSVFVPNYEEGVQRVLKGNYAFLMESTLLDYIVQRNCNLTQVGGLLDSKGYGIAMPVGSPWRDKISLAILDLQEKGVIQMLYNKWWKDTGDVCSRDEKKKDSKASPLGIANIGGVFVVLLCGLSLAIVVAMLEFCWNSRKNAQTDRQSLCSEMANELRFAVRCHAPPRRPALRRNCTRCQTTGATYVPPPPRAPPNGCDLNLPRGVENGAARHRGSFGYEVNDCT